MRTAYAVTLALSLLPACTAAVGVRGAKLPEDAAPRCAEHCSTIGMKLTAVAIMANNVGCVCQQGAASEVAGLTPATAGMATIAMQQQHRQQQQQQHR